MQDAVLSAVQRGGASLQVIRALLGEQTGATGSAGDLVMQVIELGRVPAREWGVSLELRGEDLKECLWVAAEAFVVACAEAVRRWILSIPSGSKGIVTVALKPDGTGGVHVQLGFEPAPGSLPFPMAAQEVAHAIAAALQDAGGSGQILPTGDGESPVMDLRFASSSGGSHVAW